MRKLLSRGDLLPEHMQIFVHNGEERYQFRGQKLLTVALDVIASHLLCEYEELKGVNELVVISRDQNGESWVQNQNRTSTEGVRSIFGDKYLEEYVAKPIISAEEFRVYNPERKENRRLPVAVINQRRRGMPVLIALECSAEEAVSLINEMVAIHLISEKGLIRLGTVLNEFQVKREFKKASLSKKNIEIGQQEIPDRFKYI